MKESILALQACIDKKILDDNILWVASNDAPNDYKSMLSSIADKGLYVVYSGASENSIFTTNEYNFKFRALHDHGHCKNNLSFSFKDEKKLGLIQANELYWIALKLGYSYEIAYNVFDLVHADIVGQIEFYEKTGEYVKDQKSFVLDYINKNKKAV